MKFLSRQLQIYLLKVHSRQLNLSHHHRLLQWCFAILMDFRRHYCLDLRFLMRL
jgi:hypothetical protein